MAQLNLKQLQAFVAVADQQSFKRAASQLQTTQPNISSRIAALEASLGVTLMERDSASVRLTPIGTKLLSNAREVLQSMDSFLLSAGEDHLFEGVLRLGVTEMVVHSFLGDYLTAFKTRFPNVAIDLLVDFSTNLSSALFSRSIDLSLQSGPFNQATSGSIELGHYPLVWVAASTHRFNDRALTLDHLTQHSIITHARGTQPYEQMIAYLDTLPNKNFSVIPSTNLAACLRMAIDGLGVACLPAVIVQQSLANGELQQLEHAWLPDALLFSARYDADTSPAYVALAAKLAEEIAKTD